MKLKVDDIKPELLFCIVAGCGDAIVVGRRFVICNGRCAVATAGIV